MEEGVERVGQVGHSDESDPKGEDGRIEVAELHDTQAHQAEVVRLLVTGMVELCERTGDRISDYRCQAVSFTATFYAVKKRGLQCLYSIFCSNFV